MSRWPLRARIPAIALALLLLAQVVIGFAALALVQRTLLRQTDERLLGASQSIVLRPAAAATAAGRVRLAELPSDYVVVYLDADGAVRSRVSSALSRADDMPSLPIETRHPWAVHGSRGRGARAMAPRDADAAERPRHASRSPFPSRR